MKKIISIILVSLVIFTTLFISGCSENPLESGEVEITNVDGEDRLGEDPVAKVTIKNTYENSKDVTVKVQLKTDQDTYSKEKTVMVPGNSQETYSISLDIGWFEESMDFQAKIVSVD